MKNGWPHKRLSAIADCSLGKMLDKAKNKGELKPYLRNLNVRWFDFDLSDVLEMRFLPAETARYTAVKGDVLICEGGYPGRAAIWERDEPVYFQKALHRVRFHEPERNRWFLYYLYAKDLDGTLRSHVNGAGIRHFTGEALAQFEVPIPPLPEQRRIVGILDEALEGIATARTNVEKNLRNARAVFESHLQFVFTRRGAGWLEKPLGSLVNFRNGINYTKESKGESIKIVGVRNFRTNFYAPMNDLDTVVVDGNLRELDSLRRSDILAVRSNGNVELIGRCILVGEVSEKTSHSGFTIRMRVSNGELLPEYLCYFMKSASSRKRLTDGGTGTNIKSLNQGMLSGLSIPFPPMSAQQVLVEKLDRLSAETQHLASLYERKLATLEALKKSLLHQAFTGQL
jgi:type I restriction enzyme, S subunit